MAGILWMKNITVAWAGREVLCLRQRRTNLGSEWFFFPKNLEVISDNFFGKVNWINKTTSFEISDRKWTHMMNSISTRISTKRNQSDRLILKTPKQNFFWCIFLGFLTCHPTHLFLESLSILSALVTEVERMNDHSSNNHRNERTYYCLNQQVLAGRFPSGIHIQLYQTYLLQKSSQFKKLYHHHLAI